jgi:hypothetical protein
MDTRRQRRLAGLQFATPNALTARLSLRVILPARPASYITPSDFVSDPLSDRRRSKSKYFVKTWCVSFLVAIVGSCGPELTQPSSQNISGQWTTNDQVGPLSQIQVNIIQRPDGTIEGFWSGKASPPGAPCPPGLGSAPTGTLSGANTVLQVQLSLMGAGDFDGQAVDDQTLDGSFEMCDRSYPVRFSRVAGLL